MADVKEVLDWANSVCAQALTEARAGDVSLANRVGSNSAMKLFFDNVHGTGNVQANQFPAYYAPQWKEITRLYEHYIRDEQVNEAADKVSILEARFDKLEGMITQLLENAAQPAVETPAPAAEVPAVVVDEDEEDPAPTKGKKPAAKKPEAEAVPVEGEVTPEPEA